MSEPGNEKNSENRIRSHEIKVRATDYEYMLIKKRKEESGADSLNEYILKAAIDGYIINVDYSDFKQLIFEINKIGVNINQIAHKVNSTNQVYQTDMDELQDNMKLIWKLIRAKLQQILHQIP